MGRTSLAVRSRTSANSAKNFVVRRVALGDTRSVAHLVCSGGVSRWVGAPTVGPHRTTSSASSQRREEMRRRMRLLPVFCTLQAVQHFVALIHARTRLLFARNFQDADDAAA